MVLVMKSEPPSSQGANKRELALRYQVGVRTIENWLSWGIIHGTFERGELIMDASQCDEALMRYSRKQKDSKRMTR